MGIGVIKLGIGQSLVFLVFGSVFKAKSRNFSAEDALKSYLCAFINLF